MRREERWAIAAGAVATLAVALAAAQASRSAPKVSLAIGGHGAPNITQDRVILPLSQVPVALASREASDEATLFGIDVESTVEPALAAVAPHETAAEIAAPSPQNRKSLKKRDRARTKAKSRATAELPAEVIPAAPGLASGRGLVVADAPMPAPARRNTFAAGNDGLLGRAEETGNIALRLSGATSLKVGPLSSMVPSYSRDDVGQPSRSNNEEIDKTDFSGAAVGVTFKLN